MATIWRIRLFDGPTLENAEGAATTRFRSAKVQGLLAFLALRLGRRCPREEIADALWPDELDAGVTANRLRVTLASLRRQLEPPGTAFGAVLDVSVPGSVILREATVWCDAAEFERAYGAGRRSEAAGLLRGPLLPGMVDEWVREAQLRFEILRDELADERPAPSERAEPAPTASAHHLPLYLTRFVGREDERRSVLAHLEESRLVTLTGPGGIGKTRLAVEAGEGVPWPATFVLLEGATHFAEAVLQALGIASRPDETPMAQLTGILRERPPTLLLLDNADGLLDAVADGVLRLLAEAPGVRALVTSRQRLEVPGEVVIAVPPLPTEGGVGSPSAALFLDRARNAVPDFVIRERHVASVLEICRRLEGMPLALELAAARVAVQSLAGIAASLEEGLMDLRSRQRGLSERHRSLRAAIQGSVEALSPELRRLFVRLSTFRGGWTAAAALVVGDEPQAEALLEDLVVRSLVLIREEGDELRYAFLGPLRAYAEESLPADEAAACRLRHAAYFLNLAGGVTEDDIRTLGPLDAEEENLGFSLAEGPRDERHWSGLAGALIHAFVRGHHRRAVRWIEASAPFVAEAQDPAIRFRWRYAACLILPDIGRLEEADILAHAMREDAADERGAVYADVVQAYVEEFQGSIVRSLEISEDALARARGLGDRHLLETCLSHRSGTLHVYGATLGTVSGALVEAEGLARELCEIVPPFSRRLALGPLLVAAALWPQGRLAEAVDRFKEAQLAAVRLGTTTELMYAFVSEAVIVAGWGFSEHAALLYGAFDALRERMGYSLERAQSSRSDWIESLAVTLLDRLGEEAFAALVARGRVTPPAVFAARRVNPEDVAR